MQRYRCRCRCNYRCRYRSRYSISFSVSSKGISSFTISDLTALVYSSLYLASTFFPLNIYYIYIILFSVYHYSVFKSNIIFCSACGRESHRVGMWDMLLPPGASRVRWDHLREANRGRVLVEGWLPLVLLLLFFIYLHYFCFWPNWYNINIFVRLAVLIVFFFF